MKLKALREKLSVCKLPDTAGIDLSRPLYFLGRTADEISLVCETKDAPARALAREDGWRAFCIVGQLDFSLIGILARLAAVLAEAGISIFALSTYNTDYILVRQERFEDAAKALSQAGFTLTDNTDQ